MHVYGHHPSISQHVFSAGTGGETEATNLCHLLMVTLEPTLGRLRPSSIDRFLVAMLRAALDIL